MKHTLELEYDDDNYRIVAAKINGREIVEPSTFRSLAHLLKLSVSEDHERAKGPPSPDDPKSPYFKLRHPLR